MKRRLHLPLLLLAALVVAVSYLGGAIAPPLRPANAAGPAAPAITAPQWQTLQAAMDLLLADSDAEDVYLPLIKR